MIRFLFTKNLPDVHPGLRNLSRSTQNLDLNFIAFSRRYLTNGSRSSNVESRYQIQHNPAGHPTQGFPERIKVALNSALEAEVYEHDSGIPNMLSLFDNHRCGQQWSLASRLRTPLEDLESTSPELTHKLSELSKSLSDAQSSATLTDRAAADVPAIQYRRLTEQWGAAVAEICNPEGFSRFLPTFVRWLSSSSAHDVPTLRNFASP
ncbi:hypothetical protein EV702DRAFT_1279904 [Suillus placidus]|uniref:Uncharacterized protein n=1 Tax=Suillus placidus TaxID=48579 RepID=A0A9P6ZTF6_9AGAM|nr:hypothetical protein EV702DRAFT_1279904 [Suillus placidus]